MMRKAVGFFVLLVSLVGVALPAQAKQLDFKMHKMGPNTKFNYKYLDYTGHIRSLDFYLPTQELQKGVKDFKPYSNTAANQYIYQRINAYRAKNKGVEIQVNKSATGMNISARGPSNDVVKQALSEIQEINISAQREYLHQNYLIEDTSGKYVFPDHARIASKFVKSMRPVAAAIRKKTRGEPRREVINRALNWLQTIPYDTLLSRNTANGAGFATPPGLLALNKGDCDTKSVALASVVKNIYPNVRVMMVYVPGHAFIGFNIPTRKGDRTLVIEGETFVLGEPAGPGVMPVGIISNTAETQLRKSNYSFREIS